MIRLDRMVPALLLGMLGILTLNGSRSTQVRPLSDRTMMCIMGTNGNAKGSGTSDCSDASVTANPGKNYISEGDCAARANNNVPNPAQTCLKCASGPSDEGVTPGNAGNVIVLKQQVDCSKTGSGASSLETDGNCVQGANGKGHCDGGLTPLGKACQATLAQYIVQGQPVSPD